MIDDEEITCPVCGSNNWKFYRWSFEGGKLGFRVACANGCYVDNVNMIQENEDSFDVIKTAFELIECDRNENIHKIIIGKDIVKILNLLREEETRLIGLAAVNMVSDYGRGELEGVRIAIKRLERLIGY